MDIRIITATGTKHVDSDSISPNQIGQKGLGLLKIPSLWSIPFVCIDTSVFSSYSQNKDEILRRELVIAVASRIRENLSYLNILPDDEIIIRSSGVIEGMYERGQYDSSESSVDEIEATLTALFDAIITENGELPDIAFVVQKFFKSSVQGHLSNERRFSKVKRDWVFEYSASNEKISGRISIRHWRSQSFIGTDKTLTCNSLGEIEKTLRSVADYYTRARQAVHFEFIWDGSRIILVQADMETLDNNGTENPCAYCIEVKGAESLSNLRVLHVAAEEDAKFTKIANQFLYKKAGLPIVPLYVLSGKDKIDQIRNKQLSHELEEDLKELTHNSIVIRSDIVTEDVGRKQLLARSNELRSYEDTVRWLFDQTELLSIEEEDIAFIFHIFVPALGAAFVDASPSGRIVEIEALWGLPEGLYYNAHDKITVDTKMIDTALLRPEYVEIKKSQCAYKEFYIAPNDEGKWIAKKTAQPYDWNRCISDESIKQVAVESRKIAALANKRVSVMWFIGIDETYYGTSNLAWFHEEYETGTYTASKYKKKYFYEVDTVIRNEEDYNNFLKMPNVREIKLCPTDDVLLRNKDFLKNVGNAAKKKNASIILEGTMLAHPLYQLLRTGAKVLTTQNSDNYGEEENFNKLVRDKIPERIIQNGESVSCFKLERDALLRALMEKTVEEACEIVAATSQEALLEELGDEYEVISAVKSILQEIDTFSRVQFKDIRIRQRLIDQSECIAQFRFDLLKKLSMRTKKRSKLGHIALAVSYEGTQLQVEVHFTRAEKETGLKQDDQKVDHNVLLRKSILKEAFGLASTRKKETAQQSVKKILSLIEDIGSRETLWDKEKFYQQAEKKRKTKGGFEKGYMLMSSTLRNPELQQDMQQELLLPQSEYKTQSFLDYPIVKNVDFLDKGPGELLLRLSLPLCFDCYQTVFDSNSAKKYVGMQNLLIVALTRNGSTLNISIFEKQESDYCEQEQLGF